MIAQMVKTNTQFTFSEHFYDITDFSPVVWKTDLQVYIYTKLSHKMSNEKSC